MSLPEKIYIEPTDMCNFNCSHCFRHGWIDEALGMMDISDFYFIASQIKELSSVKEVFFGGMGEPLFHPHICDMLNACGNSVKKSLLTNGYMLDEKMSTELVNAGIDELWISVDGFSKELYDNIQCGGNYERLSNNIEVFNEIRKNEECKTGKKINLCITFVITPQNVNQLNDIDDFSDYYDVDEINISHMIQGYPVKESDVLYNRLNVPTGKMHRLRSPSKNTPEDECPFISNNCMFIRWDGEVSPCMQLLHSCKTFLYEEERYITRYAYGNAGKMKILDCWNDAAYKEFRGRVKEFYFPFCRYCSGCEDRKSNQKDCFLTTAPTCGACMWASGKIFCP